MHDLAKLTSGDWSPRRPVTEGMIQRVRLLAKTLRSILGHGEVRTAVFHVPGRIELFGKHTDYAGGRSLVCATEQRLCFLASARTDDRIRMVDPRRGEEASFRIGTQVGGVPPPWSLYPRTAARAVALGLDGTPGGVDIVFDSDLPPAAGLSSSSALVIGTFLALAWRNGLKEEERWEKVLADPLSLASYLGAVEGGRSHPVLETGGGVGTRGGDQDHTAILCSTAGEIGQFRFLPTVKERSLALPEGLGFVVGVSGVQAEKTGRVKEDYNQVSFLAMQLERLWQEGRKQAPRSLGSIVRDVNGGTEALRTLVKESAGENRFALEKRLEQFVLETEEIIPIVAEALATHDMEGLKRCSEESMRVAAEWLGNQTEETLWLADRALELGAVASSGFGAGFGGSVWALVSEDSAERFAEVWGHDYKDRFPDREDHARFFRSTAGESAAEL